MNGTLEKNLADVKEELKDEIEGKQAIEEQLEATKETGEQLYQSLRASQAMTSQLWALNEAAFGKYEEVRCALANASTVSCMSSSCCGNRGSQRLLLTGCGHVVCHECIGRDLGFVINDPKTLKPYKNTMRGSCTCKFEGCTTKSYEGWILKGMCPPA